MDSTLSEIKVLLITDTPYWASHITVSNIIKHISPEFRCEKSHGLSFRPSHLKYDLVYIHCSYEYGPDTLREYRKRNTKSKMLGGVRGWISLQRCIQAIHLYDAVNANNLKLLQEVKKFHSDVHLCYGAVDTKLFKPSRRDGGPFTVGWAGDTRKELKNSELLPKLGFKYKIATKEGLGPYYPYEKMPDFYNSIDTLVQLSSYKQPGRDAEGSPLPVLEAMACGKPVLATSTSGAARECLDGYQIIMGHILAEGLEEMKGKLARLRDDKGLRKRLGERNRRLAVEKWGWDVIVKQYEKFFKSVM